MDWLTIGWWISLWLKGLLAVAIVGMLWWLLRSIRRVGPTEMAAKVIFGEMVKVLQSGIYFDLRFPLPGCELIRISTQKYKLDIPEIEAYSRATKDKTSQYGRQAIIVDATLYLSFPRNEGLIKVIRARVPTTEEGLVTYFASVVQEAVRMATGHFSWKTATESIPKLAEMANEFLRKPEFLFATLGFGCGDEDDEDNKNKDFELVIERVELPPWLKTALSEPDKERLRAEAASYTAKKQAMESVGTPLHAFAQTRGKTTEEIQQEIENNPVAQKEWLDYILEINLRMREADRGALLDIRVLDGTTLEGLIALLRHVLSGTGQTPLAQDKENIKKRKGKKKEEKEEKEEPEPWDGEELEVS